MSSELEEAQPRCVLCGNKIEGGRVAGGWSASGPGAHYHAILDECGPPLPPEPLPAPRLSGGRWPHP